jgi:hypothetical protein
MTWGFEVEPDRFVCPDPGPERLQLKRALEDCVESLLLGTPPSLWIDWIHRALAGLLPAESVIASGNAWSLVR